MLANVTLPITGTLVLMGVTFTEGHAEGVLMEDLGNAIYPRKLMAAGFKKVFIKDGEYVNSGGKPVELNTALAAYVVNDVIYYKLKG